MAVAHKIQRGYTIEVVRRELLPSDPGSAEPRHGYSRVFLTRADVTTLGGVPEIASVVVGGTAATHKFAIRFTTIPFDIRDRIRTPQGKLFQILKVEDRELANRELIILAAAQGSDDQEAAR